MLGWHISVYRQMDKGTAPATANSLKGTRLAVWQTGLGGLEWIDELVKKGKVVDLGGNGYPSYYTATVGHLTAHIVNGPHEATDILGKLWEGKTVINQAAVISCRLEEWLLVVAWDES